MSSEEIITETGPGYHDPVAHRLGATFGTRELVRLRLIEKGIGPAAFNPP